MYNDKLKIAFKNYSKTILGRTLNAEELDVFSNYMLGKDNVTQKFESVCGVGFDGIKTNRTAFKYQYEFVYDCSPTEEQLDVFIAFRIGVLKNDKLLNEVCAKKPQFIQPNLWLKIM